MAQVRSKLNLADGGVGAMRGQATCAQLASVLRAVAWHATIAANMPFPLAHPAAVLPLRRYYPHLFSLPALIIGSLVPDLGYGFGKWGIDEFSHSWTGSIGFCVPAGLFLLWVFHATRRRFVGALPQVWRDLLLPLCDRGPRPVPKVILSLLIGIWTHLVLDSFTHKNGWLVERVPFLEHSLFMVGHRNFRVSQLLWFMCTCLGVAWLCLSYFSWLRSVGGGLGLDSRFHRLFYAGLLASSVIIVSAGYRILPSPFSLLSVVVLMPIILAGFTWKTAGLSLKVRPQPSG